MTSFNIVGQEANNAIKVRFFFGEKQIGDGHVTLEQWDLMREQLNNILEEDNPIWVVNHEEFDAIVGTPA